MTLEKRSYETMRVAILRPTEYMEETILKFRKEGFDVIGVPFVRIKVNGRIGEIKLNNYDALIITSQTSAKILIDIIDNTGSLKNKKIITIGKKTAEVLQKCGIKVETPTKFDSKTLYEEFKNRLKDLKVLALRSNKGSKILLKLQDVCDFEEIKLYSIEFEHGNEQKEFVKEVFKSNNRYAIVFSSSMIVNSFIDLSKKLDFDVKNLNQICIAIGPPTKAVLERHGIKALMPSEYSFDGVIELLNKLTF